MATTLPASHLEQHQVGAAATGQLCHGAVSEERAQGGNKTKVRRSSYMGSRYTAGSCTCSCKYIIDLSPSSLKYHCALDVFYRKQ